MANEVKAQKTGLFSGFLTGSALCVLLGAAATYVSPLNPTGTGGTGPDVTSSGVAPGTPSDAANEVVIITPRSDTRREAYVSQDNEPPANDRDRSDVNTNASDASDPVQTGTVDLATPTPSDDSEAPSTKPDDPTPSTQAATPLATAEDAPEPATAPVTTAAVSAANNLDTEMAVGEKPTQDVTTVRTAEVAPRVAPASQPSASNTSADLPKEEVSTSAARPVIAPSATVQAPAVATRPTTVTTTPTADPVIALNRSSTTTIAPSAPEPVPTPQTQSVILRSQEPDETESAADPANNRVFAAPVTNDQTPLAPSAEVNTPVAPIAPSQVDAPKIDSDPERPNIALAGDVPNVTVPEAGERDAPQTNAGDAAEAASVSGRQADTPTGGEIAAAIAANLTQPDPRNPPPPTLNGRAFDQFSVRFIPPNNKPFLAVVLEHVGEGSVDMYDLLNFGKPVTFGVAMDDRLSRWRDNEFRKAGFEVVALAPAEAEAGLSDKTEDSVITQRIGQYLTLVPGAVALLDAPGSDFYRDPRKVTKAAETLNDTGRALLFHERFGANRAIEAARETGIPSAAMVRIIDDQRDAASIRRALDRAALDASKTGAAIVYGRTYPETIAAILPWLLGNSARSVTLAPLTLTMDRIVEDR